jgi:hypothetical protein
MSDETDFHNELYADYILRNGSDSKDSHDRKQHGVSLPDVWGFVDRLLFFYSSYLVVYGSDVNSRILLDDIYSLEDLLNSRTLPDLYEVVSKDERSLIINSWNSMKAQEMLMLQSRWAELYKTSFKNHAAFNSNYETDLVRLKALSAHQLTWDELKLFIVDPTIVGEADMVEHETQRQSQGFSRFDFEQNPLAYFHWVTITAILFLSSPAAAGFPGDLTHESWNKELLKMACGLYVSGFNQGEFISAADQKMVDEVIQSLPRRIPDLWD